MATNQTLDGTSVSGAHIGADASKRLAASIKDLDLTPVVPVLTVGVEAAQAIPVAVQLVDANGKAVPSVRRLLCQVLDADMEYGVEAAFTLAESGTGAEVSTTAKAGLLVTTSALGVAEVTVTDVSGVLAATVWLQVTPVDGLGSPALVPLTFT